MSITGTKQTDDEQLVKKEKTLKVRYISDNMEIKTETDWNPWLQQSKTVDDNFCLNMILSILLIKVCYSSLMKQFSYVSLHMASTTYNNGSLEMWIRQNVILLYLG